MEDRENCRDPGSSRGPSDLQSDAFPSQLSRLCQTWRLHRADIGAIGLFLMKATVILGSDRAQQDCGRGSDRAQQDCGRGSDRAQQDCGRGNDRTQQDCGRGSRAQQDCGRGSDWAQQDCGRGSDRAQQDDEHDGGPFGRREVQGGGGEGRKNDAEGDHLKSTTIALPSIVGDIGH